LECVSEEPLVPYDQALKAVSRAVTEAVALCKRPSNVIRFDVEQRRRLQRGDYTDDVLLRVTVAVDACSKYDFFDNDVCLDAMVADLDRASRSGEFVQSLKYWSSQYDVELSPFIKADGVETSSWEAQSEEDDASSSKKKKSSEDFPLGAYVFLVLVAVLVGLCCLAALAWYFFQACGECRNPFRGGVKNMGKGLGAARLPAAARAHDPPGAEARRGGDEDGPGRTRGASGPREAPAGLRRPLALRRELRRLRPAAYRAGCVPAAAHAVAGRRRRQGAAVPVP